MSDKTQTSGANRTRNYATVVYPESAPDNWLDILRDLKVSALVSPLHDKDVNPDSGEIKKAHYHVQFLFDGPKTEKQARDIAEQIGGVGIEILNSVRGMARYLCHMDNPEKYQYNPDDVITIGSADYNELISLPSDKYRIIKEILAWCDENEVFYYSDLLRYSMENRSDWFRCLCDNGTYPVKEFLKSENFKRKRETETT
jgi:hypothetical protein